MGDMKIDPYSNFVWAIRSPTTRHGYTIRLSKFFRFANVQGSSIEEQSSWFTSTPNSGGDGQDWALNHIMTYIQMLRRRVDAKELAWSTLRSNIKPIKLFCDMNDVSIPWPKLTRGLPNGRKWADDRAPTIEEIRKLVEYPDRRIKPIVYTMVSSGIRLGAWDFLKWGHITPVGMDGVSAAKIRVYVGEEEEYFTFITPEAYKALEEWMDFRKRAGEHVTNDSWLMRNLWNCRGNHRGLASKPSKLDVNGLRSLTLSAVTIQGIRDRLEPGKKRHEFKVNHGFRKYFKTHAEQVMKPINVEVLMGHATGLSDSYYRPTEKDLLEDYLKAVPLLTINEPITQDTKLDEHTKRLEELENMVRQLIKTGQLKLSP